jgi:hypothetical protein
VKETDHENPFSVKETSICSSNRSSSLFSLSESHKNQNKMGLTVKEKRAGKKKRNLKNNISQSHLSVRYSVEVLDD